MPLISYQLYSSRNFPPFANTLQMLAEIGYTSVEGYSALLENVDALKADLDQAALTMHSSHMALETLETDPKGAIQTAKSLGLQKILVPYLQPEDRPADAAGWTAFGKKLHEAGKPIQDAGLIYGWHNHDFEFEGSDGHLPLELIMDAAPDLMLELDLGWVQRAGHDPVTWINRYKNRITIAHIKDLAPADTQTEDGWADVGEGIMQWAPIHTALQEAGVDHYIVEHDNPSDHKRFATRSLAAVQKF